MKIDLYSKAVLTVIAICLVFSVAKDVITPARASGSPVDVNLVSINGIPTFYPLQVHAQ